MGRLSAPWVIQKSLRGTNLEFMLRVGMEGQDILRRGDSVLKSFDFTEREPAKIFVAWGAAARSLTAGTFDTDAIAQMAEATPALRAISSYHAQKVAASMQIGQEARRDFETAHREVAEAVSARDGLKLLELFPHAASLLFNDGDSPVPKHCTDVPSLVQRSQMAAMLMQEIDRLKDKGVSPIARLGKPEKIRNSSEAVQISSGDARRNRAVYDSILEVADRLDDIFLARRMPRAGSNPA